MSNGSTTDEPQNILEESRTIWDTNAEAWDARIGSGNGLQTKLMIPTIEKMLNLQPDERVLDIACGNGIFSRYFANLGAQVVAADFSPKLIELARNRTTDHPDRIQYHIADATNEAELLALSGPQNDLFDAIVCNNAIMDMPEIDPLFRAVSQLLKPEGRFIFSIMHPYFNGQSITMQAELPDYAQQPIYSIIVSRYLTWQATKGLAISNQPVEQYYWHRPLHVLINAASSAGLLLDRLEEPPVTPEMFSPAPFNWANYDMPPLLFARFRTRG